MAEASIFPANREVVRVIDYRRRGVERFHLGATEAFYANNGFTTIGTRMRWLLS